MMKTRKNAIFAAVVLFAVIFVSAANLKAEDVAAEPAALHARAMLVRIPASEFREFEITDDELSFPGPIEIAGILLRGDAELVTSAKVSLIKVEDGDSGYRGIHKFEQEYYLVTKRVSGNVPKSIVTNKTPMKNSVEFSVELGKSVSMISFQYKWTEFIPSEELDSDESDTTRDTMENYSFSYLTYLKAKLGETITASYQKSGDDYLILLLNISDK